MYGWYRLFVSSLRIFYFIKIRYLEHPTIKGPFAPTRHSANLQIVVTNSKSPKIIIKRGRHLRSTTSEAGKIRNLFRQTEAISGASSRSILASRVVPFIWSDEGEESDSARMLTNRGIPEADV